MLKLDLFSRKYKSNTSCINLFLFLISLKKGQKKHVVVVSFDISNAYKKVDIYLLKDILTNFIPPSGVLIWVSSTISFQTLTSSGHSYLELKKPSTFSGRITKSPLTVAVMPQSMFPKICSSVQKVPLGKKSQENNQIPRIRPFKVALISTTHDGRPRDSKIAHNRGRTDYHSKVSIGTGEPY